MANIAGKLKQKDNQNELFKDLLTAEDYRPAYKRKHTKDVNQLMQLCLTSVEVSI